MFWWQHLIGGGGLAIAVPEQKTVSLSRDDGRALVHYLLDLPPRQARLFPSEDEALSWLREDLCSAPGCSSHVLSWRADDQVELWQEDSEDNPVLVVKISQRQGRPLEPVALG